MKKIYLLSLLVFLITGCKYGSKYEAEKACEKWANEGFTIRFVDRQFKNRRCWNEKATNRYLGFEYKGAKNKFYKYYEWERSNIKEQVVKRFKY